MRRLKHKHTRRAVHFFEINYGFRKPFKVVLDGNFVHALRATSLGDPAEVLSNLLGSPVKVYITRCSLLELKGLGSEFSETWAAARKAAMHLSCGHDDKAKSTTQCIMDNIGEANAEHFFVATQDRDLRAALGGVPGGASIFLNVNGVHLEPPSEAQKRSVEHKDQQNMGVAEHELKSGALKDLPQLAKQPREKSLFRRNRAKGPNPLAVRKKQKSGNGGGAAAAKKLPEDAARKPKRKRVRKRGAVEKVISEDAAADAKQ